MSSAQGQAPGDGCRLGDDGQTQDTHLARMRKQALWRHLSYDRTPESAIESDKGGGEGGAGRDKVPQGRKQARGSVGSVSDRQDGGAVGAAQVTQHKSLRMLALHEARPCLTNWCSIAALKPTGTQAWLSMAQHGSAWLDGIQRGSDPARWASDAPARRRQVTSRQRGFLRGAGRSGASAGEARRGR